MNVNHFYGQDLISTRALNRDQVEAILQTAKTYKEGTAQCQLTDKIIATCFFEPSTRTRLSFEAAAMRLGANVIGFSDAQNLSIQKGESLSDTMRMLEGYADLIVLRHPNEGAATLAADCVNIPVINAGDGANQHPSQALTDFFTIAECQDKLDGLNIALCGDLKHARAMHSFLDLCALYDVRLYLIAPPALTLPETLCDTLKKRGVRFSFHQQLSEVMDHIDILYMTRIQRERIAAEAQGVANIVLQADLLKKVKPNFKILHPLPRQQELPAAFDDSPYAYWFQQANNGLYVRQALLSLILNEALYE